MNSFNGDQIRIFHNDDFKFVPDGSIDLVLTDPPFNIARETNFHTYEGNTINSFKFDGDKGWDSNSPDEFRLLLRVWAVEFNRVLRAGGSFAIFCADEYLSDLINALREAGLKPRRTVTWRKPNAVPVNRKHLMMSACEYIVVGVKGGRATFNADLALSGAPTYEFPEIVNIADKICSILEGEIRKFLKTQPQRLERTTLGDKISNVIEDHLPGAIERATKIYSNVSFASLCVPNYVSFNSKTGNRLHPTEKPVELLTYLLSLLSNDGDTILDPFSGSGSTGEASFLAGRKSILVEKDREFFEKSVERLQRITGKDQLELFP
jgi:DNA modification methylase